MPAIQPERLKAQAAGLAEYLNEPPVYVRKLHQLLDFYADRARRSGHAGRPGPLIQAYRVRPPVLRALVQAVLPQVQAQPEPSLALCDALWGEPFLEFRQLAAMLLGQVTPNPPDRIIGRLKRWITVGLERHLVDTLLSIGIERLHREQPQAMLQVVHGWLENPLPFYQQLGLRALLPLVADSSFENLPVLFRLLQPMCLETPGSLRPDILEVLNALTQRSPAETAFFLRQCLAHPDGRDAPGLVRQSLAGFPPDLQAGLRSAARELDRRSPGAGARSRSQ